MKLIIYIFVYINYYIYLDIIVLKIWMLTYNYNKINIFE
jgi:hypothetical protein